MDFDYVFQAIQAGHALENQNTVLRQHLETMRRVIAGLRTDLQRAIASRDELKGDLGRINAEYDRLLKALGEFQHISTIRLVRDWAEKWSPVLQRNQSQSAATFVPFHQCEQRQQYRMMSAAKNFLRAVSNDDVKGLVTCLLESDQFLSILRMLIVSKLSCPVLDIATFSYFPPSFHSKQIPMRPDCQISKSSSKRRLKKL